MTVVINGTTGITTPTESVATTIGVGGATPSANGAGITFPATQSASSDANTLDDYEEGSWTPALKFGANNVGMTGNFTGRYTKAGNVVNIVGFFQVTNKGSSTGIAQIFNLPFSVASNGTNTFSTCPIYVSGGSISLSAGTLLQPNVNNTVIDMNFVTTTSGADANLNHASFASAGSFWITASYLTT